MGQNVALCGNWFMHLQKGINQGQPAQPGQAVLDLYSQTILKNILCLVFQDFVHMNVTTSDWLNHTSQSEVVLHSNAANYRELETLERLYRSRGLIFLLR